MNMDLDALATSYGIITDDVLNDDGSSPLSETVKESLLQALGIDPTTADPGGFDASSRPTLRCAFPDHLEGKRLWGVTCQLYAVRSANSLGIGDFDDLGRLAEICAAAGASFLGVNPLHALFFADPSRTSPYSPSSRRFLNPLYIAVHRVGEEASSDEGAASPGNGSTPDVLEAELVDYAAVSRLKHTKLRGLFDELGDSLTQDPAFQSFREKGGAGLRNFALFEALSFQMHERQGAAGWHGWPDQFHSRQSPDVCAFEAANESEIQFHEWLQYVADRQLHQAHARALAAGMSIGLYLDLAVGVAPDGAETWADPELVVRGARVGASPDMFNADGQDWGLAPLSPRVLEERSFEPLADIYRSMMSWGGAVRIDHAMGLTRLWWIPDEETSSRGGYVQYPLGGMIDALARASDQESCVVIGEDLGVVPEGFRPVLEDARILSYRVVFFERSDDGAFLRPDQYPNLALASVSTHDLPTLAGWWIGEDLKLRAELASQTEEELLKAMGERSEDRRALLEALEDEELIDCEEGASAASVDRDLTPLTHELAVAIHRYGSRSKAALFAVQLDDILLSTRQANVPGTTDERPNWRIRTSVMLEELPQDERFIAVSKAVGSERAAHENQAAVLKP
jgi:4-alpha-glucanotransferase